MQHFHPPRQRAPRTHAWRSCALAHACEQTQARLAEVLARLSAEQRQQLDQRARALVAVRESDFGYRIMLQFACEDLARQEYLGFDRWPQLVAQVRARSKCSFAEMVALDREYIGNRSLWLDLRIMIETTLVVLLRKGAY